MYFNSLITNWIIIFLSTLLLKSILNSIKDSRGWGLRYATALIIPFVSLQFPTGNVDQIDQVQYHVRVSALEKSGMTFQTISIYNVRVDVINISCLSVGTIQNSVSGFALIVGPICFKRGK